MLWVAPRQLQCMKQRGLVADVVGQQQHQARVHGVAFWRGQALVRRDQRLIKIVAGLQVGLGVQHVGFLVRGRS
ncbi:hypothetical protein D3C71_2019300 [compost metagenome]